jgi:hypothetical protein
VKKYPRIVDNENDNVLNHCQDEGDVDNNEELCDVSEMRDFWQFSFHNKVECHL